MSLLDKIKAMFEFKAPSDSGAEQRTRAYEVLARANALLLQCKHEEALSAYDRALNGGVAGERVYEGRAVCLQALGYDLDAIDDLSAAIATKPNDSNLYFMRAMSRQTIGDFRSAVEDIAEAVRVAIRVPSEQTTYDLQAREWGHSDVANFYKMQLLLATGFLDEERRSEERRRQNPAVDLGPTLSSTRQARARRRPQHD